MSNLKAATKSSGFGRKINAIALMVMLGGCSGINHETLTWKTYSNSRYGFEFPYPSNWTSLPPPENNDGIAFFSPQNESVEIRGWAGNRIPESLGKDQNTKKSIDPNFKTAQGVSGVLTVEVGSQQSLMTLKLTQGQLNYYWQGRCESEKFDDYYRFFYYIAQQYRIRGSGE